MKVLAPFNLLAAALCAAFLLVAGLKEAAARQPRQELYFSKPQALAKSESALMRGDAEAAKKLLQRALDRGLGRTHSYTAHNNLCVAHFMLKEYEAAVTHCREAISIRSNLWRAYNNLGNALAKLGRYDAAIEAYSNGLKLNSKNETLEKNLELVIRRKRLEDPRSRVGMPPALG